MATLTQKYKPYPAYKPSGVEWLGEIPAHWETATVKHQYTIQLGKMLQNGPSGQEDVEVPYLRAVHVQWFDVQTSDLPTMWASQMEKELFGIEEGDLLVCEGGEGGRCGIFKSNVCGYIIQNALHRVRPREHSRNDYLQYTLSTTATMGWFGAINERATIAHLTGEKFGALKIPFPPLPEQRAIAAFLDGETVRIDALVAKKERLIALLHEKRAALITRAVTRGLDPNTPVKDSGVEWLREIPAHWEVKRLKYSAPFHNDKLESKPEDAIYVGLENIEPWTGELLLDAQPDSVGSTVVTFCPGDVLFGKLRPYLAKVARPDFDGTATSEVLVMRPMDECSQDYLAYCLLNVPYTRWVDTLTYGAKMPRVSPDDVACSFIPLPPLPEQRAIAAFLGQETAKLDSLVGKVREAIERLRELRTALISAAVTGRIDVREEAGCK